MFDFLNLYHNQAIKPFSSLPCNLGSPYLVVTLIMEGTSLASMHVSTDFDLSFMVYWWTSFNVHTLIMEIELHACLLVKHVSPDLDLFSLSTDLNLQQVFLIRSIFQMPYNLGLSLVASWSTRWSFRILLSSFLD